MKILVKNKKNLNSFLSSLPLIKGLSDLFSNSTIHILSNSCYEEFSEHIPYINKFVDENVTFENYQVVIDLDEWKCHGSELLQQNMQSITNDRKIHSVDRYLRILPPSFRKRKFVFKETASGFEKLKAIKKNKYDLVIYPASAQDNVWTLESYDEFIGYFLKMNPEKKILIVGLEVQREILENFFLDKNYYGKFVDLEIIDLETLISLGKRTSHVLLPSSPIKYFFTNDETQVIEIVDNYLVDTCYKENSYSIRLNTLQNKKFFIKTDELPFDKDEHYMAYFITSILDEDYEKLNWLCEVYSSKALIGQTLICKNTGLRHRPMSWKRESIIEYLIQFFFQYHFNEVSTLSAADSFYYDMHDETDLSQDRIMYELSIIKKEFSKLKIFFEKENHFSQQLKIKNYDIYKIEGIILHHLIQRSVSCQIYTHLNSISTFLSATLSIAGQKLLENTLPSSEMYC